MAIIHSPLLATVVYGGPAVLAGCAMVTTVYARLRRPNNLPDFWRKISIQSLIVLGGSITWAVTIQDYYRSLPPDHACISEYSDDGRRTTSWSLFASSCY
jgi:hypothetical protein